MDASLAFFAVLAMALGFKHAFDVDHLVAVSNVLTRSDRLERTVGLAGSWAAGHMVTAALVSGAVFVFGPRSGRTSRTA